MQRTGAAGFRHHRLADIGRLHQVNSCIDIGGKTKRMPTFLLEKSASLSRDMKDTTALAAWI